MLSCAVRAHLPRLAIALLFIFTERMTIAFTSGWFGFFGFLFLPWTTLAWTLCYAPFVGVRFRWFIVLFGFFRRYLVIRKQPQPSAQQLGQNRVVLQGSGGRTLLTRAFMPNTDTDPGSSSEPSAEELAELRAEVKFLREQVAQQESCDGQASVKQPSVVAHCVVHRSHRDGVCARTAVSVLGVGEERSDRH